ncbi:MAG: protein-L-isoaspartate(D-aspartate) O-methyltransferase [Bryobacteraceae bacterium]
MIPNWAEERRSMVATQLARRGISDRRVLRALAEIPREQFVPLDLRIQAYADEPLAIGFGQTISQPYMTALMAEQLCLDGSETVLEVGTGCGYAAAVLAMLAARVVTIELIPALADLARENLRRTGRGGNVLAIAGDGCLGYEDLAPYDAISVAAAAPEIPAALVRQLRDPGSLVMPVGGDGDQELRVVTKLDGHIGSCVATHCRFVPLRGGKERR